MIKLLLNLEMGSRKYYRLIKVPVRPMVNDIIIIPSDGYKVLRVTLMDGQNHIKVDVHNPTFRKDNWLIANGWTRE